MLVGVLRYARSTRRLYSQYNSGSVLLQPRLGIRAGVRPIGGFGGQNDR